MCAFCGAAQVIEVLFLLVVQLIMLGLSFIVAFLEFALSFVYRRK